MSTHDKEAINERQTLVTQLIFRCGMYTYSIAVENDIHEKSKIYGFSIICFL